MSILDQMEAAKGTDSPYAWFYDMHQRHPWNTFVGRRDLEAAKLKAYLFQITAPMNKFKVNEGLTAYIKKREPNGPKVEIVRK